MAHEYLTDLNREQRLAVKHGITNDSAINLVPLLVIAGAGTGKTKTVKVMTSTIPGGFAGFNRKRRSSNP
jgi:hypothetical protein